MSADEKVLRDPKSDDEAVARAAARMADGGAPASFWASVADDARPRPFQRALAIRHLFERHVPKGSTLKQCAALLAGARWLSGAPVEKVERMGGELPVRVHAGGSAFVIRLPRGSGSGEAEAGLYLSLDTDIEAEALRAALMSKSNSWLSNDVCVTDFAFFPESLGRTSNE